MTPRERRLHRVWFPLIAVGAATFALGATLTATVNGLQLGSLLVVALATWRAAKDGRP